MPEKEKLPINIWGKPRCGLPSGGLCDACCNIKFIDSPWGKKRFLKQGLTDCNLMKRFKGGQGCGVYSFAPDACENYHCGDDTSNEKIKLIEYALKSNLVSAQQSEEAIKRIKR
jgi:hypothetical protein